MIISRSCYLKEPEKWFGTKEEKEVVALSVDYINNNTIPSNKPVWIEGKVLYDNSVAIHMVTKLMKMSKDVLEVYNGANNRSNRKI